MVGVGGQVVLRGVAAVEHVGEGEQGGLSSEDWAGCDIEDLVY